MEERKAKEIDSFYKNKQELNSLSVGLISDITKHFKHARENDDVKVIILTGNGRGFCAGADLTKKRGEKKPDEKKLTLGEALNEGMEKTYTPMMKEIAKRNKPLINGINGLAIGGGNY